METMLNQQAARQVYTLCYRITACPQAARLAAQEALADPRPLRRAVALCVERAPGLKDGSPAPAGCTPLERALFSLPWRQRLALVLLDQLGLAPLPGRWHHEPTPIAKGPASSMEPAGPSPFCPRFARCGYPYRFIVRADPQTAAAYGPIPRAGQGRVFHAPVPLFSAC